jgi:hypothetical protein
VGQHNINYRTLVTETSTISQKLEGMNVGKDIYAKKEKE